MEKPFFKVLHRSKKSKARLGEIATSHGIIQTPAFVPVATKGTLKTIPPHYLKELGVQVAFVNTYHLVNHPGADIIARTGGIHQFSKLDISLMSDSGGFQVFSLAKSKIEKQKSAAQIGIQKHQVKKAEIRGEEEPLIVKISDDGVLFRSTYDGKLLEFTPEKSIAYQMEIGADIMMAFDECTPYPSTYAYANKAMIRTHNWLKRCMEEFKIQQAKFKKKIKNSKFENCKFIGKRESDIESYPRYLYGVIQGGTYEALRKESAQFVASQATDGVAIGGVAVGEPKEEMRKEVKWVSAYLPENKPVHLLGVGQFDDILDTVGYGVDTFDCVEPTRMGRMGHIYQKPKIKHHNDILKIKNNFTEIDIQRAVYKNDLSPVDEACDCYVCRNFTKAYLHHLFKQKEILGYTLATYHNLFTFKFFFEKLREAIGRDEI